MNASNLNVTTARDGLQQNIDLLGREFHSQYFSRPIAASIGIADDVLDPDDLYEFCEERIGSSGVQEGYVEPDEEIDESESDLPIIGEGAAIPSFEGYLALHEHFGSAWLEEALVSFEMAKSGRSHAEAAVLVNRAIGRGLASYANSVSHTVAIKLMVVTTEIGNILGDLPAVMRRAA